MDLNLKNHVVVVTGGGSGIGRASAMTFAAEGSNVAIWDLGNSAKRVAEEIEGAFPVRAIGISADVTDESVVLAATEQTTKVLVRSITWCMRRELDRENSAFHLQICVQRIGCASCR